ncbi:hypothetical protein DFH29DRAFT_348295 [Suillus ampliporus]|nr:hypothetical protein DFH29DRAFT_348295 [Suillus ampliporus]
MEAKETVETSSHQRAHSGQRGSDTPTSLPASTRCMIIFDLQWKIFQLVHDTSMDPSRNKTLLTLALTCKSFTGLALDLLWQDLCGLAPLIKCLPQSLWKDVKGKLEFQRIMTFDDWCIFRKYNHRVHSLNTSVDGVIPINTGIWRTLSCPPFSLPLLPNLMSLIWSEATSETFPYIRLFITQKLTTLSIISEELTFGLSEQSILSSIPMLCPSVSNFSVHSDMKSEDISTALQCWSHLSSVSTGKISEAAILHLSNLPSLQFLKFHLPSLPISTNMRKLLQHPAFHALQELDIECDTLELLDAFLETLSIAPEVLSVTITFQAHTARHLPALISRISNVCAHASLQQVQLTIVDVTVGNDGIIGAAVFRPLYANRNLRKFDFDVDIFAQLDDAGLLQMAKA